MISNCEINQVEEDNFSVNGRLVKIYIQFEQVKGKDINIYFNIIIIFE